MIVLVLTAILVVLVLGFFGRPILSTGGSLLVFLLIAYFATELSPAALMLVGSAFVGTVSS